MKVLLPFLQTSRIFEKVSGVIYFDRSLKILITFRYCFNTFSCLSAYYFIATFLTYSSQNHLSVFQHSQIAH
ncbi:hypothetical protein APX70_00307 [Pseudomonas syringae pv. maculicola]|uniref:Uncharacterized protein n=1 Tax=Pseudomonas syringae pv. maculicola TaxID=59511 RepID=A0A3M2ZEF4_PSEYM|nr:hypothetical protein APX70_00307 [Pseudomonas syringae pv. maculicola]